MSGNGHSGFIAPIEGEIMERRKQRGRGMGFRHAQVTRDRIKTAYIVRQLTLHFMGKIKLRQSQIRVGFGLLAKTMPDLKQVQVTIEHHNSPHEMTQGQINARLAEIKRLLEAAGGGSAPPDGDGNSDGRALVVSALRDVYDAELDSFEDAPDDLRATGEGSAQGD